MSAVVQELEPVVPRNRRRWLTALRWGLGIPLLFLAGMSPFFPVRTHDEPRVECGSPAVRIMFDGGDYEEAADCRAAARGLILGGIFLLAAPGMLLLGGRRLGVWSRDRAEARVSRMQETGVWTFPSRYGALVSGLSMFSGVLAIAWSSSSAGDRATLVGMMIFFAGWCFLVAARPRVDLRSDVIDIVNPLQRFTVPWSDIASVQTEKGFMHLRRHDGAMVKIWIGVIPRWGRGEAARRRSALLADAIMNRVSRDGQR